MDTLAKVLAASARGERAVLVTVVATRGSTPRKPGARMLVYADGRTSGSIGGGTVEHTVIAEALTALEKKTPALVTHLLTAELAMCCGGEMTFFVEPLVQQPTLLVFGLGHVGAAIVRAASPLGFSIVGVDDLDDNASATRLPTVERFIRSYELDDLREVPFDDDTYVVIATREHALDQKLLEWCVEKPWRYLGVIGSERKAAMQRQRLEAKGLASTRIAQIRCPMGVDIGAETPEEIAISVCAELVQVLRR